MIINVIRGAGFVLIMGLVLVVVIIYTVIKIRKQVKEKKSPHKNSVHKPHPEKKTSNNSPKGE